MRIAIIGGGNMGEAILKSLLRKRIATRRDIIVVEILSTLRDKLSKKYGIETGSDSILAVKDRQVVILAVKPKDLKGLVEHIKAHLRDQLVISIVAGYSLQAIQRDSKYSNIIRAMPNTPAQVGLGMTAWTASNTLSHDQHEIGRKILSALGEEQYFSDEDYIDMATAVSGSGPAYVYLFIEAMIDAAVHIGLPRKTAEKLVIETVVGSAEAMKKTSLHPAEMKNMVTSPGGTTTDALFQLETGGMRSLIISAVNAAYQKAKSLGTK